MTVNLKTVYGLILVSDPEQAQRIFRSINPEWNKSKFYEQLHEAIGSIFSSGSKLDVMSIVSHFRSKGLVDKGLILKLSNLTQDIPVEARLHISSVLGEVERAYQVYKANLTASKIKELVDSDNYTTEKYVEILESAKPQKKVEHTRSNSESIFDIVEDHDKAKNGVIPGIDLFWRTFHNEIILEPVDLMVVGARPAMGKTAFAVSLAVNLAFKSRLNVVFFSLEMSKKQIMRRVVSNLAAIDSNRIKYGECSESELRRIYSIQEAEELENLKIFEGSHSLNDITLILSDLKLENKIDVVVIDYLQKIVPKSKGSRYEQVTEVSNGVKVIAQNMHIPVIALAQLSRDSSKIGKLPTLTDLRESGEIEQDASVVSFLHRPEYYGEELTSNGNRAENVCEVLIAKNREGSVGKYEMGVDLSLSKFFDL